MKTWIPMLILLIAVIGLCAWDGVHTNRVFERLENDSMAIYEKVLSTDITDENLQEQIKNLDDYWTEKMDILCISISRKDLQVVSDYLQYLYSAMINENQEDAITYSRILAYNIKGLNQTNGIDVLNLL